MPAPGSARVLTAVLEKYARRSRIAAAAPGTSYKSHERPLCELTDGSF